MDISVIIFIFKVLVLIGGVMAAWFGTMLIFFYERFAYFNELINNQYLVGQEKYQDGSAYKVDSWVMGWHTILGVCCLLAAAWMFWTFFTYLKL